ncbi:MAG: ABC transporter permease [Acidobacteriota bacterium]|nr:ABC transporter permease [Acidobacteriota bacterium]
MRSPAQTAFAAIFQNEVLLNSKRVAPYALMILFAANAVLWWGHGPAVRLGWATNSDFYIVRNLLGFSFLLGLPIFNAVIMCDPVIRDFRIGFEPLIFSKPISRASYLLGKFFGNFFVLVCCQSAFVLTLVVLQAFRTSHMIVQSVRVFPYFKHFFFFVVISHLVLAAFYFTVGTLTRNSKIVYGAAVAFYPIYISYQVFLLKGLPVRWQIFLDPMLINSDLKGNGFLNSADFLNRYVVSYTPDMIANRALMGVVAAACLTILYFRFAIAEPNRNAEKFSVLNLSTAAERLYYDPETFEAARSDQFEKRDFEGGVNPDSVPLPVVNRKNDGVKANLRKLVAAIALELRLLRSERSLIILIPLAVLLSFVSLPFSAGVSDVSHSLAFASSSAQGSLLFLLGVIVFSVGEAMHRDREVKVEPVLWSAPAPNNVFLISKFLATLLLVVFLLLLIGLTAMLTQFLRGQTPIEVSAYLIIYSIILVPSLAFMAAACIALNILLRDKYLAYAIIIGISSGLFYLYTQGYTHWLYNPVLYGLWIPADLTGTTAGASRIVALRLYCISLTLLFLLTTHLFFQRPGKAIGRLRRLHR